MMMHITHNEPRIVQAHPQQLACNLTWNYEVSCLTAGKWFKLELPGQRTRLLFNSLEDKLKLGYKREAQHQCNVNFWEEQSDGVRVQVTDKTLLETGQEVAVLPGQDVKHLGP